jgi:hypothetical protein
VIRGTVEKGWIALIPIILIAVVAAALLLGSEDEGWVKVPIDNSEYKGLAGEEVTIAGLLEANDRLVLAIASGAKPTLITEEEVDRIVSEGLKGQYDFREPGWTHRIRMENEEIEPNFIIDGDHCYVILSTGTDVWRSENVLKDYEDAEVEIIGKWDSYMDPVYPTLSVPQFRARYIRKAA